MLSYYEQLRLQHGLPVLPIALYLRVGLDGIGWDVYEETYWDHRLLSFTYAYVGLPGLEGEQYVAGEHLLGVALTALMRVPPARRAAVHAEALRRLAEARENDYRRHLLLDCFEAYATLDEAQQAKLADRSYIEQLARQELDMCFPDTQCYVIEGSQPLITAARPQQPQPATWYAKLWQSVQQADATSSK